MRNKRNERRTEGMIREREGIWRAIEVTIGETEEMWRTNEEMRKET
jgi:hypothetical protein